MFLLVNAKSGRGQDIQALKMDPFGIQADKYMSITCKNNVRVWILKSDVSLSELLQPCST